LFGKPPFTASNLVELTKIIQTKPLEIPKNKNNIQDITEDVLRKMLVVDPKKRIDWEDLFAHKINFYLEDKVKHDFEATMKEEGLLAMNMSKFYIKNNQVIDHPAEIKKKEEINNYALKMANGTNL
jgi:serine/threonine-protein kinase ULK/ATG1